jgi:ABC-type nitrate/sulfonate/bicarbonate transport system permease component
MAYMALVGIFGFAQDRFVLLLETVLLRWKR